MSVYRNTLVKTVVALVFIGVLSFCAYWIIRTVFVIQVIEIEGEGISIIVDEKNISKNLLFFPSDRIRSEILQSNQLLADVVFHKKFPHTLVLQPILRHPYVVIKTPDRIALIDKKGYVLEYGDQGQRLPVIYSSVAFMQKGEKISSEQILFALNVIDSVQSFGLVVSVREMEEKTVEVSMEKMKVLFSSDADLPHAIATLQTLIAGFRIKGTLPSVVDLRFDKPVVQF